MPIGDASMGVAPMGATHACKHCAHRSRLHGHCPCWRPLLQMTALAGGNPGRNIHMMDRCSDTPQVTISSLATLVQKEGGE
ncbi:hypothetical protein BHE74_00024696 [Ensete ventricosum]|nr:hypothetical protein BHE74_00024696 [Ensete ventricosum]